MSQVPYSNYLSYTEYSLLNSYPNPSSPIGDFLSRPLRGVLGGTAFGRRHSEKLMCPKARIIFGLYLAGSLVSMVNYFTDRKIERLAPMLGSFLRIIPFSTIAVAFAGFIGLLLKHYSGEKQLIEQQIKKLQEHLKEQEKLFIKSKPKQLLKMSTVRLELPSILDNVTSHETQEAVFGQHVPKEELEGFVPDLFVTYRGLSDNKRQEVRQKIYNELCKLATDKEVKLPFVNYEGHSIFLKKEEDRLIFRCIHTSQAPYSIVIHPDGSTLFSCDMLSIENEGSECTFADGYHVGPDPLGDKIEKLYKGDNCHDSLERYFHKGPAFIELLTVKLLEVKSFLSGTGESQAISILKNILKIFQSFSSSAEELALVETKNEWEAFSIGPMVNPVVSSEDSVYTWTFLRNNKEGEISLQLAKSANRGLGSGSSRELVFTQKLSDPHSLRVEIGKNEYDNFNGHSSLCSKYTLTIEGKKISVIPEGREAKIIPFYSLFQESHASATQNVATIKEDIDYAMKVLTTISDLNCNPHTVVLRQNERREFIGYYTLSGTPIPEEYVRRRLEFPQGLLIGSSALASTKGSSKFWLDHSQKTLRGKPLPISKTKEEK